MSRELAMKSYLISKTNVQLTEVQLESVRTIKNRDVASGEYQVSFGIGSKVEIINEDKPLDSLKCVPIWKEMNPN